jgi:hypothetical protein
MIHKLPKTSPCYNPKLPCVGSWSVHNATRRSRTPSRWSTWGVRFWRLERHDFIKDTDDFFRGRMLHSVMHDRKTTPPRVSRERTPGTPYSFTSAIHMSVQQFCCGNPIPSVLETHLANEMRRNELSFELNVTHPNNFAFAHTCGTGTRCQDSVVDWNRLIDDCWEVEPLPHLSYHPSFRSASTKPISSSMLSRKSLT